MENLDELTREFDSQVREGAKKYDKELFNDYTLEELESFPEDDDNEDDDD